MAGCYYTSLSGGVQTASQVSSKLDSYDWVSSWRFSDADELYWNAADPPGSSNWMIPGFPATLIIDTSTMILQSSSNVLADAQALNI